MGGKEGRKTCTQQNPRASCLFLPLLFVSCVASEGAKGATLLPFRRFHVRCCNRHNRQGTPHLTQRMPVTSHTPPIHPKNERGLYVCRVGGVSPNVFFLRTPQQQNERYFFQKIARKWGKGSNERAPPSPYFASLSPPLFLVTHGLDSPLLGCAASWHWPAPLALAPLAGLAHPKPAPPPTTHTHT